VNGEFIGLVVLLCISLAALASSNGYLTLFVAIELQSLALYIILATNLVPTRIFMSNTSKVSLSYLINAGMATALLLFGMSLNSTALILVAVL
jgi:NADH-quinone oxidoreductase subunit N